MPNGGVLPSCFVCKWAKEKTSERKLDLIECQKHGFAVWLPMSHVCINLGDPYDGSGLSTFAEDAELKSNIVYVWLQFQYRTQDAPTIPQYHHELVELTTFQEFSKWTIEEKEESFRLARKMKEQELTNSSDESAS